MIICPGCGAGMRFDIASQMLKCDFCGQTSSVSQAAVGKEARQSEMELNAFVCPQCAGTIYSTDDQATSFCLFCGASVELEGRMKKTLRPTHIIPFKKTKEECKQIYGSLTKKAFFAPKELKDPEFLDRFQGIYLPFWTYHFTQNGTVSLQGERETANYTEVLNLSCQLNSDYDALSYDASSAFNDELCSCIVPYNSESIEDFNPAYLSGFYADIADVPSELYVEDAEDQVNRQTEKQIRSNFSGVSIKWPGDKSRAYHTQFEGASPAMFPVWFLTWRKGDRVAYAVVNGETGRLAADLPIDKGRFLTGTLLMAIPIFLLLLSFPVITPGLLIVIASLLSLLTLVIYFINSSQLGSREQRKKDKGFQYRLLSHPEAASVMTERKPEKLGVGAAIFPFAGMIAGIFIRFLNPVSDLYYYGGTMLILVCCLLCLLHLVNRFNYVVTRPIPEFHDREGGDPDER